MRRIDFALVCYSPRVFSDMLILINWWKHSVCGREFNKKLQLSTVRKN